jgi:hypothetical protein
MSALFALLQAFNPGPMDNSEKTGWEYTPPAKPKIKKMGLANFCLRNPRCLPALRPRAESLQTLY